MPTIMIYQSPRSAQLKRKAAAAVTTAIAEAYDVQPEQIQVYFHEFGGDRWARGGRLAGDRDVESTPSG
jgi:phenylpyruvate tautomerase PptA (4-oxalocrotonate tautomerase family)